MQGQHVAATAADVSSQENQLASKQSPISQTSVALSPSGNGEGDLPDIARRSEELSMSLMESNSALREKESRHRKECNRLRQALKQQAANCRMVEDDADRYIIGLTGTIVNQREEILRWKREIEQMRRVYDLEIRETRKEVMKEAEEMYEKELCDVEESLLKAREDDIERLRNATKKAAKIIRSDAVAEVKSSHEEAMGVLQTNAERKLSRAVQAALNESKLKHEEELQELADKHKREIANILAEAEEAKVAAVDQAVSQTRKEGEWVLDRAPNDMEGMHQTELSEMKVRLGQERREAIEDARFEQALILAEVKEAFDEQTRTLQSDHKAAMNILNYESAHSNDGALKRVRTALKKTQQCLLGGVGLDTETDDLSSLETTPSIREGSDYGTESHSMKAAIQTQEEELASLQDQFVDPKVAASCEAHHSVSTASLTATSMHAEKTASVNAEVSYDLTVKESLDEGDQIESNGLII